MNVCYPINFGKLAMGRFWPILRGSGRRITRITAAPAFPWFPAPQADLPNSLVWETDESSDMALCLRPCVPIFPASAAHADWSLSAPLDLILQLIPGHAK